jgi:hypothetical protein
MLARIGTARLRLLRLSPTKVAGEPDESCICTSHVEKANLSFRTQLRRFTLLALGFSKKLHNLKAAVAFYVAYYNFCRVHRTLRVTPAMEAALTGHVWTIEELLRNGQRTQEAAA